MSHLQVWFLLGVAAIASAVLGINTLDTAMSCIYFGGAALLAHWIWEKP